MGIGLAKKIVAVLFRIDSNIKIPQKTWWVSYIFIYSKQYFHVVSGWCFQSFVKWMLLFSLLVLKATKIRLRAIGSAKQPGFKPQKTCFHAQDIIFKPSTWRSDRKNFVPLIASTWGIAVFFYPPSPRKQFPRRQGGTLEVSSKYFDLDDRQQVLLLAGKSPDGQFGSRNSIRFAVMSDNCTKGTPLGTVYLIS